VPRRRRGRDAGDGGVSEPWVPMTVTIDLKHLGKLAEEANELGAAVSRCIIQGIDRAEPVTGKPNRGWLEEEIADVLANCDLVVNHFGLDKAAIAARAAAKKRRLGAWHAELRQIGLGCR
jgi:NTP pyrophosphatase (non-canonical NTP hydrolase)